MSVIMVIHFLVLSLYGSIEDQEGVIWAHICFNYIYLFETAARIGACKGMKNYWNDRRE